MYLILHSEALFRRCHIFFSRLDAGLTNQVPVRDSRAGAPLEKEPKMATVNDPIVDTSDFSLMVKSIVPITLHIVASSTTYTHSSLTYIGL